MGPLVPDIITNELNLVVALLLGIGFGFILEQAGFSSSRKLTGLFYGTDFTVLRVFFTAGTTAMIGVLLLAKLGLLDLEIIYINPAFLPSAILGGVIMGLGFVIGGYCPGTSFCGAAVGRVDGMAFVGGGLIGVLGFAEVFPRVQTFYEAGSLGDVTVPSVMGISPGLFGIALVAVAIVAFIVTTRIERHVNPASTASGFRIGPHRLAAAGLMAAAIVVGVMPDYDDRLLASVANEPEAASRVARMTADELAYRIVDHDPSLLIVDVRPPDEFGKSGLPQAVNIPVSEVFGKEWRATLGRVRVRKVFVADDEAAADRAARLSLRLGYTNVSVLEGGLAGFRQIILDAQMPEGSLTPDERDLWEFRAEAGATIASLINARGVVKPVERKVKKVSGGCGA